MPRGIPNSILPKHYHNYLLDEFEKGTCYIYCAKCEKTTLHEPIKIRKDRYKIKLDGKVVAFMLKFRCKECGMIIAFKRKNI